MDEKVLRKEIQKLIDKFERIKKEGKYKKYNEEDTKKDFILPLFRTLGWNVEDSDEVKAEEKVSKKRVDYAFRIDGIDKFFLEAKALKEYTSDSKYIGQAIEYAYNKSVPWAVLCNFETLRVFNAEFKFNEKNPLQNVVLDFRYTDYLSDGFEKLLWLSKESFENRTLDTQAILIGKKIRKLPIGKQLLVDFTEYRRMLTKDIVKQNPTKKLTQDELDEIVQKLLDRIIFIRTCEDKEIESEKLESLVRIYGEKKEILLKELNKRFREYDNGYNSRLFTEHLCEKITISNEILKQVILGTYQSKNLHVKYDFSAINADVLGNIYEQYLGHILKTTPKRAKLTNGKVHRKEQGIYYTPTYIVEYIVKNTIGNKLKKRKIVIDELKILDPACGSGSFLLKAFDYLWEYVKRKEKKAHQTKFEEISIGSLLKRKTELLKNTIFGVDLDSQAVEITQLNLLLKLAEKRQRLPTLQENIKCGNSLIENIEIAGNKAFKWSEEFTNIMQKGGFDIIVGNPPYVNIYLMDEKERDYFNKSNEYQTTYLKYDIYILFLEGALSLLKNDGYLGFIVPYSFLNQPYAMLLRKYILETCSILSIIDFSSYNVFQSSTVRSCIIILRKEKNQSKRNNNKIEIVKQKQYTGGIDKQKNTSYVTQKHYQNTLQNMFRLDINKDVLSISEKIKNQSIKLGSICYVSKGIVAYSKIDERKKDDFIHTDKINSNCVPYLEGKDVKEYRIDYKNIYLEYIPEIMSRPTFPELHDNTKILVRAMTNRLSSTLDENGFYVDQKLIICSKRTIIDKYIKPSKRPKEKLVDNAEKYDERYIIGLLNSSLMWYYYKSLIYGGLSIHPQDIRDLPIRKINFSKLMEKKLHDDITELVRKIMNLNKHLEKIRTKKTDDFIKTENKIIKSHNKINDIVYKLYGLNKEEIDIIKGKLKD